MVNGKMQPKSELRRFGGEHSQKALCQVYGRLTLAIDGLSAVANLRPGLGPILLRQDIHL